MKLTRRQLAFLPAAALAQNAASQQDNRNEMEIARQRLRENAATVARVDLPMATEPSFQFKV